MGIDWLPFLSFTFITIFTPGPNNISSMSIGLLYGYRSTLAYLLGIAIGFFGLMLAAGFVASTLVQAFPAAQDILRCVGTAYILWLALSALLLAAITFCAVSTWTLFGSTIRRFLSDTRIQRGVNIVLALLLVVTALDILGMF